jgi:hypothetical protein
LVNLLRSSKKKFLGRTQRFFKQAYVIELILLKKQAILFSALSACYRATPEGGFRVGWPIKQFDGCGHFFPNRSAFCSHAVLSFLLFDFFCLNSKVAQI